MPECKVTFNRNVKLGEFLYRSGDTAIVAEDVCNELAALQVINADFERILKESKTIEEMTVSELKEYAINNNIDLGEAKKRDEILAVIQSPIDEE